MPQARLPDINTAFIVYRREAISSWKSQNYDSCFGSLQTLNGLLPETYRVLISTKDYDVKVNMDILYICSGCKEKSEQKMLTVKEILLPVTTNFISGVEKEKVWECPKCNVTNRLEETDRIKQVLQEPYFLGVVPKPPVRKEGMLDRTRYHINFSRWFWSCLSEIEAKMAEFRDDNWHKTGEEYDFDEDVGNAGEDQD